MKIKYYIFVCWGLFILGCDFTPPIYKQIIKAQQAIYQQNYFEAIKRYNLVLDSNPENKIKIKIYFQLSNLYSINLGQNEKGITYLEKIKKMTTDPLWLIKVEEKLGENNFIYLKDFRSSIQNYDRLTQFIPKLEKYDFYQLRLAQSYYNVHYYNEALSIFKEIQKKPSHKYYVDSFFMIGKTYFQTKKWKNAIKYFKEYLKREKQVDKIIQAKFLMANTYETLEKLKIAYDIYYSILSSYPNTQVIKNRLNSIYKRRVSRKR